MYKKLSIVLILIIIALITYYNFYTTEPKVGVINMNKLLTESKRAQELQADLEETGQELEEKYENTNGSNSNSAEQENQIYAEFAQNKQEIEQKLNNEIDTVIEEINKDNQYSVILYKNKVYFGGEDITDHVINRLDQKYTETDTNETE
ncbi:MAG: OmpH family outer membrane protein [Halanaerobiales bacterium]|nr:OmpH family outer membrane protein [Halanaerobiales bacterium]